MELTGKTRSADEVPDCPVGLLYPSCSFERLPCSEDDLSKPAGCSHCPIEVRPAALVFDETLRTLLERGLLRSPAGEDIFGWAGLPRASLGDPESSGWCHLRDALQTALLTMHKMIKVFWTVTVL